MHTVYIILWKRTEDYPVYKQARELGALVKSAGGDSNYEGWCWSGSRAWIDFFNPNRGTGASHCLRLNRAKGGLGQRIP